MAEHAMDFPYLERIARESGIPPVNLVRVFELEREFHDRILATPEREGRIVQYSELYNAIHPLLRGTCQSAAASSKFHRRLVMLFRRELAGKSVLDIGCGNGQFLREIDKQLPHMELCGLDTSAAELPFGSSSSVTFVQQDISSFRLNRSFDVVFSHQVLEHIAPADLPGHIDSIRNALNPDGVFIVLLPNKGWGPHDITMIVDASCRGRIAAMGSHLNESSYTDLIPVLESHGFREIRTILPLADKLPPFRRLRVRPRLNLFIERHGSFRRCVDAFRFRGKPIFKNHVILICRTT
jgi:SAM-dependent methyltransferase